MGDYVRLTKPSSILPHFVAATAAMLLAAGSLPPGMTLLYTLVGGGMVAAAANVLNCYFDRDIDGRMERTRNRPLPAGRLAPSRALLFGIGVGLSGLTMLGFLVGPLAAALAASALAYYVLVYTLWLKRRTRWSVVISSGAGAFTPLIGWAAVAHSLAPAPLLLFLLIALWTVPHFWSLAVSRRSDYALARLTMTPAGAERWIWVYSAALASLTLLLRPVFSLGVTYSISASVLGAGLVLLAVSMKRGGARGARLLYSYSVFYIAALFAAMMADRIQSFT